MIGNDDDDDSDMMVMKSLQCVGRVTPSFSVIPDQLQKLCFVAKECVGNYTLFNNPFHISLDVYNLIYEAWERAQDTEKCYQAQTKACDSLVEH